MIEQGDNEALEVGHSQPYSARELARFKRSEYFMRTIYIHRIMYEHNQCSHPRLAVSGVAAVDIGL